MYSYTLSLPLVDSKQLSLKGATAILGAPVHCFHMNIIHYRPMLISVCSGSALVTHPSLHETSSWPHSERRWDTVRLAWAHDEVVCNRALAYLDRFIGCCLVEVECHHGIKLGEEFQVFLDGLPFKLSFLLCVSATGKTERNCRLYYQVAIHIIWAQKATYRLNYSFSLLIALNIGKYLFVLNFTNHAIPIAWRTCSFGKLTLEAAWV